MDGKRLKQLRLSRKLTQEELGRRINLTKTSVSGYESGNRSPDIATLKLLADYFCCSTDYLLGRDTTNNNNDAVASTIHLLKEIDQVKGNLKAMLKYVEAIEKTIKDRLK